MLQLIRPSTRSESHMACFGELNFLAAYFATLSVEDKGKVVSFLLFCRKIYWRIGGGHSHSLSKSVQDGGKWVTFTVTIRICLMNETFRMYWIKGCVCPTASMN